LRARPLNYAGLFVYCYPLINGRIALAKGDIVAGIINRCPTLTQGHVSPFINMIFCTVTPYILAID
jgi:hypothetical protein